MKHNKIVNNSYNTGEIIYEAFTGTLKVVDKIAEMYKDQLSDDLVDVRQHNELSEEMYSLFVKSPYYEKYKNPKKVEKVDILNIYYYFKDILAKKNLYTLTQIFISIAEFFQINYKQLHGQIGVLDKEILLKEMVEYNEKHKIIKVKKLF
jgi:hypothetical protein